MAFDFPPPPHAVGDLHYNDDNCGTYVWDGEKWVTYCCVDDPHDPTEPNFTGGFADIISVGCDNGYKTMGVGNGGRVILTTDGGETWATVNNNISNNLTGVTWDNGRWFAVADQRSVYVSDDDGKTWTNKPNSYGSNPIRHIIGNKKGKITAVGGEGNSNATRLITSTDHGETWVVRDGFGDGAGGNGMHHLSYDHDLDEWCWGRWSSCGGCHRAYVSPGAPTINSARGASPGGMPPQMYYVGHGYYLCNSPDNSNIQVASDWNGPWEDRSIGNSGSDGGAYYSFINDEAVVVCGNGRVRASNDWAGGLSQWRDIGMNFSGPFSRNHVVITTSNEKHEVILYNSSLSSGIGYRRK